MLRDLTDKRALVTGAGQGLGRAIAELFVERGARVLLTDVDGSKVRSVADDLGDAAKSVRCDVRDAVQVQGAIDAATSIWGGLDIVVNNAGIEIGKPLNETGVEEFANLFDINVKGTFLGIKYAIPALAASGGGAIVNMSSVAGTGGVPLLGAYCASKAAVIRLTETAAIELRAANIRVNAVCPSFIDTDMVTRLVKPFEGATGVDFDVLVAAKQQRLGTGEEVAEMVAFLASDDAGFITGAHYILDGGLTASMF